MKLAPEYSPISKFNESERKAFDMAMAGNNVVIGVKHGPESSCVLSSILVVMSSQCLNPNPTPFNNIVCITEGVKDMDITSETVLIAFNGLDGVSVDCLSRIDVMCQEYTGVVAPFGGIQVVVACHNYSNSCFVASGIDVVFPHYYQPV